MPGLISLLIPLDWTAVCSGEHEAFPPGVFSFCSRPLWSGAPAWANNQILQAVIGAALVIGFWLWMAHAQKVVPGKRQFVGEFVYNMIRNNVARDMLGHDFQKYLPYLLALFSFILVNNLFGEFFVFMFPTFSKIGFAWILAACTFVIYNGAGIAKHGFGTYLKHSVLPAGVPWPLWFLIIPLEFLSNFIVRPITLALRLFANLFAGHLVVLVFVVGGTTLLLATADGGGMPRWLLNGAGVASLVFSLAIFALEIFVGVLQAYIFTVLTAQYISSALAEEH